MRHGLVKVGGPVVALIVTATLAACGGASGGSGGKQIVLGFPAALTGSAAAYGKPQAEAAQMLVDQINKDGGVKELGGMTVKLLVEDTKSDPATATRIVREMAPQVTMFVGPQISSEVVAAKPLIESLKIPTASSALDPTTTQNGHYLFRNLPSITAMTQQGVDYVKHLIGGGIYPNIKRVGILMNNQPPGPAQLPVLEKGLEDLGLTTTVVQYDPTQVKDFAPIVAKFKADNVDLVTGDQYPNDIIQFAHAVGAQSWRPPAGFFFVGSGIDQSDVLKAAGDDMIGWTATAHYMNVDSDYFSPEAHEFAKAYAAKTGTDLAMSTGAAGAANVSLALDAIAAAKSTDPAKVTEALRNNVRFTDPKGSLYPYYTAPGGVNFGSGGDNQAAVTAVLQLTKGGGVQYVWPDALKTADLVPAGQPQ
jgi:branched-chain amino acid transport system substrate-binding protein